MPEDDEKWYNYLLLLDIIDILFARRITEDIPGALHDLVQLGTSYELCKIVSK